MNGWRKAEGTRQDTARRTTDDGRRDGGEIVACIAFCFVASALLGLACAVCLVPFALL
jgi:hypothetical protein